MNMLNFNAIQTALATGKNRGKTVVLRLVEVEDAAFVISLRTDNTLNRFLSPVDNSIEQQREWIQRYKIRELAGTEFYFIIASATARKPVGTIRLYDFVGDSFCWGSWIVKPEAPVGAAVQAALIVNNLGYNVLGFSKCHLDVRKNNTRVIQFHMSWGARKVGENELDCYFENDAATFKTVFTRFGPHLLGIPV
jgi:RimJ/RimL family protein N-acetyltransferase